MIKYPNGKIYSLEKQPIKKRKRIASAANRGMLFEDAINKSNEYYIKQNIALINKRPTPINVVHVDYSKGARITDAYFEKQSTTDYNGVYQGYYLDFEAKSTKIKTSFPLHNITVHQIKHLKGVINHGGIAFFLIEFYTRKEVYLLEAKYVIDCYGNSNRKSIAYDDVKKHGYLVPLKYMPRYDYLAIVKKHLIK